jgi:SulP family sulfate permease
MQVPMPHRAQAPPVHPILRVVPALDSLRTYSLRDARKDVVAGMTVAAVAVPQAMAYGMVAGLPPEVGLYTAIVMTGVGALFDSSKQLINGPTNAISIAVLSALAAIAAPDERLAAAVLFAFLVGAVQLSITLLRLGDLSRYISHSVIVGFTLGASVLLVLDQLKNLLGMASVGDVHDHFLLRFWLTMTQGGGVHPATAALGVGTILVTVALRWLKRRLRLHLFPELLVVIVGSAALVAWLGLDAQGVKVVGEIPAKLPQFQLPRVDAVQVRRLAPSALAIATLGLLEAIAMAKGIAAQTRQKLDINQQCLSEGLANLSGSFFQCMPGSGSLTRSAINQQAGAVTQWSGVVSAVFVAAIVLLFAPWARFIPRSALAGILIVSSWRMVDRHALVYHLRATRFDAVIVGVTALSAVAISVEFCVLIGVFLSILLTVPRIRILLTEFVVSPEGVIDERHGEEAVCDRILIFGLEGEMFFGASASLEQHLDAIEERVSDATKVVVLRVKRVRSPDAVCMTLLGDFADRMQARGVHVLLGGVRPDLADALQKTGITAKLGADHVFLEQKVRHSSTLQAVRHAYELVDHTCDTCPRRDQASREQLYFMV